ncbi:MAG: hypothetical protein ACW960_16375, partial [Candidatus Thorarchaeota archaeon]
DKTDTIEVRSMSEEERITLVPTSSMDFEKQVLILRSFVVLTDMGKNPVHYKRVVSMTRTARSQISGTNSFFVGLGFLKRVDKGTYLPAKELVEFFSKTPGEEDFLVLRPLLEKSALFATVKNLMLVHGEATEKETIEYVLRESGEKTESRARRALDWLEKAGLVFINPRGQLLIRE